VVQVFCVARAGRYVTNAARRRARRLFGSRGCRTLWRGWRQRGEGRRQSDLQGSQSGQRHTQPKDRHPMARKQESLGHARHSADSTVNQTGMLRSRGQSEERRRIGRQLVERARAGDADAFDQLVREKLDSVYRLALWHPRRIGRRARRDAGSVRNCLQKLRLFATRPNLMPGLARSRSTPAAWPCARRKPCASSDYFPKPTSQRPTDQPLSPSESSRLRQCLRSADGRPARALLDHHLDVAGSTSCQSGWACRSSPVKSRLFTARKGARVGDEGQRQ
jgi:hypothetical protein